MTSTWVGSQWGRTPGAAQSAPQGSGLTNDQIGVGWTQAADLMSPTSGAMADATAIINQTLSNYGLQGLSQWAWNQITDGATADSVLVNIYQTPQFAQRFPGIIARQKQGLPPISPSEYISYEDNAKQLENQYGLPTGFLSDHQRIGDLIAKDVSATELTDRVQNGYAAVQYAPPEVRQAFTQMFGANGDGALASHFLDTTHAAKLLTQQATAAQISGEATMGGINMDTGHAMQLAQLGHTAQSAQAPLQQLQKENPLYDATMGEQNNLLEGQQGVEAAFGTDASAAQQVIQRQQAREAQFQGGGGTQINQYGTDVGAARPR